MPDENEIRTTKPTLETLLALVREIRDSQDAFQRSLENLQRNQEALQRNQEALQSNQEALQKNQEALQQNQAQFAGRLDELIKEQKETKLRIIRLGSKFDALNRNLLEAETDFRDLVFRVEELENKTP
jgi:chromosome segregation ATPase